MIRQPLGYRFGQFEVAPEAAELRQQGESLHLEPKVLQVLVYLIEHRQRLVTKGELLDQVWDGEFVTENALTKAIGRLRKALGDDAQQPRYIHTQHTLGYRFIAEVEETGGGRVPKESTGKAVSAAAQRGRRPWLGLAVGAGLALGVVALLIGLDRRAARERILAGETAPEIRSLAVLPLVNLTGDPGQNYFVDGIQEALITNLAKIDSLRVISRQSASRYRGSDKPAPEIAREMGVDALVEGSVMRDGDRVGIWVQLIHGSSDQHRWAESYEREEGSVLYLVNDVARTISNELRLALTPEQSRLLSDGRPVDPQVHDLYLEARHHMSQWRRGGKEKARKLFKSALDLDPEFAPAHAGVAAASLLSGLGGGLPQESMAAARAAALRAIDLDDRVAEAHTVLGWVRLAFDWDWQGAEVAFRRALELNSSSAVAQHGYGDYLTVMGRPEEGLEHVLLGRRCDPLSPMAHDVVLAHLSMLRRHDQVIVESRKALDLFPGFRRAQLRLGWALLFEDRYEEGLAELRSAPDSDPAINDALERGFAEAGPRGAATAMAELLVARAESTYVDPRRIAAHYARGGEVDEAMLWLERAFENRSPLLVLIKASPDFDSVRTDPRFEELVRRIGLP